MEKITKHITIGLTEDNQAAISISKDTTAAEAFQLLGTLALHILKAYEQVAITTLQQSNSSDTQLSKKELDAATEGIKESIYDTADNIFSSVLSQFYPDAPRNEIEEEAIIKLQNQLIEERYNKLSQKEKASFKEHYNKMKYVLSINSLLQKQGQKHGTTDSERS